MRRKECVATSHAKQGAPEYELRERRPSYSSAARRSLESPWKSPGVQPPAARYEAGAMQLFHLEVLGSPDIELCSASSCVLLALRQDAAAWWPAKSPQRRYRPGGPSPGSWLPSASALQYFAPAEPRSPAWRWNGNGNASAGASPCKQGTDSPKPARRPMEGPTPLLAGSTAIPASRWLEFWRLSCSGPIEHSTAHPGGAFCWLIRDLTREPRKSFLGCPTGGNHMISP